MISLEQLEKQSRNTQLQYLLNKEKECRKMISDSEKLLSELKTILEHIKSIRNSAMIPQNTGKEYRRIKAGEERIFHLVESMLNEFCLPPGMKPEVNDDYSYASLQEVNQFLGITSFQKEEMIFIKLPLLQAKRTHYSVSGRKRIGTDYQRRYEENIFAELMNRDYRWDQYQEKNVMYLHLYHPKPDSNTVRVIPDSDNYDTKKITDAVTRPCGGDDAPNCTFFYCSMISNAIPEGTYITISKGLYPKVTAEELVSHWEAYLNGGETIRTRPETAPPPL